MRSDVTYHRREMISNLKYFLAHRRIVARDTKKTWLPKTINNREEFRHASFTQSVQFQELEKHKRKKLDSQKSYEIFVKK